jgi:hypothetical protein
MKNIVFLANHTHYRDWIGKTYFDLINYIASNNNSYKIYIFYDDEDSTYVYNQIMNIKPIFILYFETRVIEAQTFNFIFELNIPYVVILLDMFYVNQIQNDYYIQNAKTLIHFSLNKSIEHTYSNLFSDKCILSLPSRYINVNKFKNYNLEKKYDILIYGTRKFYYDYKNEPIMSIQKYIEKYEQFHNTQINSNINFYPLRSKLENILSKYENKYRLKILPEKCIYDAIIANEDLSMLINQSHLTVSCSTIADIMMHKYLEISASKSVILGDIPSDYTDLFGGNIVEVNEFMPEEEIINIIDKALSDKEKLNEMSERLYEKIHTEHNFDKAINDFNNLFEILRSTII